LAGELTPGFGLRGGYSRASSEIEEQRAEAVACDFSGFGAPGRQWLTMSHVLYPFRYRDPLTGKWVRARYKADITALTPTQN
jgi:hypothetical protein